MKIYATITPAFQAACKEWLEASVRHAEPEAALQVEVIPVEGTSDFGSVSFSAHNVEKNKRLVGWIRENIGETIFVTDADIVYFRPLLKDLEWELGTADIALSRETFFEKDGYNIGQMVIRCSEKVASFFEDVGKELAMGAWDQEAINRLLGVSGLHHRFLSFRFTNTGVWYPLPAEGKRNALCFHATATWATAQKSSMELKRERVSDVAREWCHLNQGENLSFLRTWDLEVEKNQLVFAVDVGGGVRILEIAGFECRPQNAYRLLCMMVQKQPELFVGKQGAVAFGDNPPRLEWAARHQLACSVTKFAGEASACLPFPCPYSLSWPQVGIADGKRLMDELLNDNSEIEDERIFWIGANMHPSRARLSEIAMENPELFDVEVMEWDRGAAGGQRSKTRYVSLPEHRRYKYLIDCPGLGYSARIKWLLATGRPVFIVV